jgi:hypothetical protein
MFWVRIGLGEIADSDHGKEPSAEKKRMRRLEAH